MIDFTRLLKDDDDALIDPRDIFLTLNKDKRFAFPRDIQTEVMNAWFATRVQEDTIIKLNVGSGKTLVGLLLLQSCINEECGPALYVCPDRQLVAQVVEEAKLLGIGTILDPKHPSFETSEKICVTTIHKIFNGKSVFGVDHEGIKIKIGALMVDDAHACAAAVSNQYRIILPSNHDAYSTIFELVADDLERQSQAKFLDLQNGDPLVKLEVPFWSWQDRIKDVLRVLHASKESEHLKFLFPLLSEVLIQCRCIIGGQELQIEPICPPTDLIRAFIKAKRRIYMTATLSDDSVIVTHFCGDPQTLKKPIVPILSQSMGERMILLPQDLNPELEDTDIKQLLVKLSEDVNVVVLVPSEAASMNWVDVADQILMADNVVEGVERLRNGHVGLTILVNRYDGIDLPDDACRVLAVVDLPEVKSYRESFDMTVLANSKVNLRRQMQRIEQGMGRGVRSNDDYCVVVLCGARLTRRLKSLDGRAMLTGATQAQLDLSTKLAKQIKGISLQDLEGVVRRCLDRDEDWITVNKKILIKAKSNGGLALDSMAMATRTSFDLFKSGDYLSAARVLEHAVNETDDSDVQAWLKVRLAEITHPIDPASAQKILLTANKLNSNVLKPLSGVKFQKLKPLAEKQASKVKSYHTDNFVDAADRITYTKALLEDLVFNSDHTNKFESAIDNVAQMIGLSSQRPENQFGFGPDNLWASQDRVFLVIECKSGATSTDGISKHDMGQLEQSMSWFKNKYTDEIPVTPVMIHPLNMIGPGATSVDHMRVITNRELKKLKTAFESFNMSLGDVNILSDVERIVDQLTTHAFTLSSFVSKYTVSVSNKTVSRRARRPK